MLWVEGKGVAELHKFYCDFHLHIGRNSQGKRVKIVGAKNLIFENIAKECLERKGINILGIVDCASPRVQQDIEELLESGELVELAKGGLCYRKKTVILLASEVETGEKAGCSAHHLVYLPYWKKMKEYTEIMAKEYIKNVNISTQKAYLNMGELINLVDSLGGVVVPAHAFTPHKGIYGNCVARLAEILTPEQIKKIPAIELGLSADSDLADQVSEVREMSFLTNSDAHSLPKIGREYNVLWLEEPNFEEVLMAWRRQRGRKVLANYGLDPRLGKYHRTFCLDCESIVQGEPPLFRCDQCGSSKVVKGVLDRIKEIADQPNGLHPDYRPPYNYQIPLEFVPGVGSKTLAKLINHFGSEMAVLHEASQEGLIEVVGEKIGKNIALAREGRLELVVGGGGHYGKVLAE